MIHEPISKHATDVEVAASTAHGHLCAAEDPMARVRALLHGVSHVIESLGPNDDANAAQAIVSICEEELEKVEASLALARAAVHPLTALGAPTTPQPEEPSETMQD